MGKTETRILHAALAKALLEEALEMLVDGEDPIPVVSEALANLKAELGEASPEDAIELLELAGDRE